MSLGGLNKKPIDWSRCIRCRKKFYENEAKTMHPGDNGFVCESCCKKEEKHGGDGLK